MIIWKNPHIFSFLSSCNWDLLQRVARLASSSQFLSFISCQNGKRPLNFQTTTLERGALDYMDGLMMVPFDAIGWQGERQDTSQVLGIRNWKIQGWARPKMPRRQSPSSAQINKSGIGQKRSSDPSWESPSSFLANFPFHTRGRNNDGIVWKSNGNLSSF